jgi:tetratricopeptide (TPR) repeat protein
MNVTVDILRGELERLFSLEDLTSMSERLLGLDPKEVGGESAKASFARALAERCVEADRVEALVDVMVFSKKSVDPRVYDAVAQFGKERLEAGKAFGPFTVKRIIEESELSFVAECTRQDKAYIVKLLKRVAMADRRAVQRFLTANRMIAEVTHESLPKGLEAGEFEGSAYVAYEAVEGEPLSKRAARTGPQHFQELRALLRGVLEPLALLHAKGLIHGDLKLDHVMVDKAGKVHLVDFGGDKLRQRSGANGQSGLLAVLGSPRTVAPEVLRGKPADARSDIYAFGAMLAELLSGKPVFSANTPTDAALAHLSEEPAPPSARAPRGWVTSDVDKFVLSLLDKDPSRRPKDAGSLLEQLESLGKPVVVAQPMDASRYETLRSAFMAAPSASDAALAFEQAVGEGADPMGVGQTFFEVAQAQSGSEGDALELKKSLLYRAARIFDGPGKDKARAEEVYAAIVAADASDDVARMALEDVRKKLGKYEELVEMLLERAQSATDSAGRADAYAEIGSVYSHELDDEDQALVAYTQALCEAPERAQVAAEIERLAGDKAERWNETLSTVMSAIQSGATGDRNKLMLRAGQWYDVRVGRADMALMAFQQVVQAEPSNEDALEGLTRIYRKAQQWPELMSMLLSRADASASSPKARDYRVEAAELLETKLNDAKRAREVYERVLGEDPGHVKAGDALARITERTGDFAALVVILERRADARRGVEKADALVKVAEVYEDHLNDLGEATKRYEMALAQDPKHLGALKGLDRVFNRTGRYRELLDVLERQVAAAATPRQKVNLYERMAALHDEEFLDHEAAAQALEKIVALDPSHDGALSGLARHLRALDRWDRVIATYDKHIASLTDENRKVDLTLQKARTLAENIGSPERAIKTYEEVLKLRPGHAGALEALAALKEVSGDAHAALSAIEALAAKAETPEAKAEQWVRAGRLLESRGDRDAAIERYKTALDMNPRDVAAASALRKAYAERGDAGSVVSLVERELQFAESDLQRARLHAELSRVFTQLGDAAKAEGSARRALELDASNAEALWVMGDLAFEGERFLEAQKHYDSLVGRIQVLPKDAGTRVLTRFIEAFGKSSPRPSLSSVPEGGSVVPPAQTNPKLQLAVEQLLAVAGADTKALALAANVVFDHGDPRLVMRVYEDLFKQHDARLVGPERAEALYHLGESARRSGELDKAVAPLRDAIKIVPTHDRALRALGRLYEQTGDWEESIRMRRKRAEAAPPGERFDIYLEIGDLEFQKLNDRGRAQKTYAKALEERPDDRKLLTKLMQLYSEEKDWAKLVDVVTKLADFVEDSKQRAKYMHTAATIASRHLNQTDKALSFYERALEFDPSLTKAAEESMELYRSKKDYNAVEGLLNTQLDMAKDRGDTPRMVQILDELGELYRKFISDTEAAIDAYEAAQVLEPDNKERAETLALLYASDPKQYLDKAVKSQTQLLRGNPYRVESYKLLRRLYTESKKADPAWCLCQGLAVLNLADPDEERFYGKHRSENAAAAQAVAEEEDWLTLEHEDVDALLTRIFALIQPVVVAARTQPLQALGYDTRYALDTSRHPYPMSQTLYYAGGVLGMGHVKVFQNPNDPGGLGFIHAHEPSILLGQAALETQVSTQMLAFLAGRHLAYFRPGYYVRHLIPTGTGLKAWLFAAIKHCVPNFPIAPDLAGPVAEAMQSMQAMVVGPQKDLLTSTVSKLLQSGGAIDLKRWVAGIDLTADRVGFVLAHDLQTATELIRAVEHESSVPVKERMKEIVLFSVSEEYFTIRRKLRIAIDS